MTYGSCRFLFHQFIQRVKAHETITDADALTTLSAALVRRADIDRLDQIMGCISGQFVHIRFLMDLLDKQFQILIMPQEYHAEAERSPATRAAAEEAVSGFEEMKSWASYL